MSLQIRPNDKFAFLSANNCSCVKITSHNTHLELKGNVDSHYYIKNESGQINLNFI